MKLDLQISQGSVVTHLKQGANNYTHVRIIDICSMFCQTVACQILLKLVDVSQWGP